MKVVLGQSAVRFTAFDQESSFLDLSFSMLGGSLSVNLVKAIMA